MKSLAGSGACGPSVPHTKRRTQSQSRLRSSLRLRRVRFEDIGEVIRTGRVPARLFACTAIRKNRTDVRSRSSASCTPSTILRMVPLPQEGGWGTVRVKLPREGVPGKRHKKGAAPGRKPRRKGQLLLLRARNKTIHVTELHSFQNIFTQKRRKRLTGLSKRNTILYCISMSK